MILKKKLKVKNQKNSISSILNFRPKVLSRHPSHNILRAINKTLSLLPFKSVVRLGSTTDLTDTVTNGGNRIELNTVDAIKNSSNKLLMKQCFANLKVKTADWWKASYDNPGSFINMPKFLNPSFEGDGEDDGMTGLEFPIVAKHIFGSRGTGNTLIRNQEELERWLGGKTLSNYIFEKFYNYNREYRLHVTEDGCFYTCRKMLKENTDEDKRWFRNDSNSVWIMEENDQFDKPVNWDDIVRQSVLALKAVGLDFGAIDLRIQSSINKNGELRENPDFIIVEINSAPSFGEITAQKYIKELPKLLLKKYNQLKNE